MSNESTDPASQVVPTMAAHAQPTAEKSLIQLLEAAYQARRPDQKPKIKPRSRQTPFCFLLNKENRP